MVKISSRLFGLYFFIMRKFNEINMNSEGFIYLNSNIRIHALKLKLYKHFERYGEKLSQQCLSCSNDSCLSAVEDKFKGFITRKDKVLN